MIVEKTTTPWKSRYQYAIKETVLVSSGEEEVDRVKGLGYTLIGETEHGTAHIRRFVKVSHE